MCFSESVIIRAAPGDAFAYLADPDTAPIIDPAVISYTPDSLPMGVGTRNTVRARLFGLPFAVSMVSEVRVWEPGRRMVIESIRPARPIRGVATHLFEDHPEGTRYTWSMEIVPTGLAGRLIAPLMSGFLRRNAVRQQARLKAVLEGGRL